MTHWTATSQFILIEVPPRKKTTDGGIVLPDTNKKPKIATGKVVAYGPEALGVKCGDTAFYQSEYAKDVADNIVSVSADCVVALQRDDDGNGE